MAGGGAKTKNGDICGGPASVDRFARIADGLKREYFFYCHGVDGVFSYLSPSVTDILGYTPGEFLVNYDKFLTSNPANREVFRHTRQSIKGVRQPPYEVEVYHKDGSVRTLEVLEIPVRHKGRVVGVEGIAKDVTEQKRTRDLLRLHGLEMEEQARVILQSSGDGIIGVDMAGDVTFANDSALRLLGWSGKELLGRPLHETVHYKKPDGSPYPRSECPMNAAAVLGREERRDNELLFRKDGSSFAAAYSTRPVHRGGELAGAVVTFSDVTERKSMERMKDLLMHAIVHDLNTPLAVIMAGAELAADCPGQLPGCANRESLSMVFEMANEMKRMLSDILDISRMEEGKMRLDLRRLSAAKLLRTAAAEMAPLVKVNSRTMAVSAPGALPAVNADERTLRRVLENLISNAMRYTPSGTGITVEAAREDGGVRFSVSDQGKGINPEHLERVFDKYFQSQSIGQASRQGKGLGLTFCRMAVEAHGGRIWAENLPGRGCRFSFTLPAAARKRAAKKK